MRVLSAECVETTTKCVSVVCLCRYCVLGVQGVPSWALDRLCGTGNITHKVAIHMAQGAAVAWLQHAFRPEQVRVLARARLSTCIKDW